MLMGGSSSASSIASQSSDAAEFASISVPEPVDYQRGVRLVGIDQAAQRLAERAHEVAVVGTLLIGRCEAGCEHEAIPLADWQIELLCKVNEELAARTRAAGLDEA